MKVAVLQFPGSNRDRDAIAAIEKISGTTVIQAWQEEDVPNGTDLVIVPGGSPTEIICEQALSRLERRL